MLHTLMFLPSVDASEQYQFVASVELALRNSGHEYLEYDVPSHRWNHLEAFLGMLGYDLMTVGSDTGEYVLELLRSARESYAHGAHDYFTMISSATEGYDNVALVFPFRGAIPRPREVAPWINFVDLETLSDDAIVEKVDLGDPKVTNFLIAKDERAAKNVDTRVQALLDKASDASFYSELYDWTLGDKDKDLGDEEGDEEGDDAGDKEGDEGFNGEEGDDFIAEDDAQLSEVSDLGDDFDADPSLYEAEPEAELEAELEAEPEAEPGDVFYDAREGGEGETSAEKGGDTDDDTDDFGAGGGTAGTPKKTSQTLRAPRPQEPRPRQAVHDPARRRRRVQARPCRPAARRRRALRGAPLARRHGVTAALGRSSHPAARRRRRAHRGPISWRRAFRRGTPRSPARRSPFLQIFRCRRTRTSPAGSAAAETARS